ALSRSSRAASHCSRVPVLCVVIVRRSFESPSPFGAFPIRWSIDDLVPAIEGGELQVWRDFHGLADHGRGAGPRHGGSPPRAGPGRLARAPPRPPAAPPLPAPP